jgi:ABC-type proline/glycine betaine transport system permease subunit
LGQVSLPESSKTILENQTLLLFFAIIVDPSLVGAVGECLAAAAAAAAGAEMRKQEEVEEAAFLVGVEVEVEQKVHQWALQNTRYS